MIETVIWIFNNLNVLSFFFNIYKLILCSIQYMCSHFMKIWINPLTFLNQYIYLKKPKPPTPVIICVTCFYRHKDERVHIYLCMMITCDTRSFLCRLTHHLVSLRAIIKNSFDLCGKRSSFFIEDDSFIKIFVFCKRRTDK